MGMQTYVVILCGSLVFFLGSLFFGDHHGGDVGGHDAGHHHGGDTTDIFTVRNLFLFGVGFGAAGTIASYYQTNPIISAVCAVAVGLVLAAAGIWVYRIVKRQEGNSVVSLSVMEGRQATVITSIPEGGMGEISTRDPHGATVNLAATSAQGALHQGAQVQILAMAGNVASVKPV